MLSHANLQPRPTGCCGSRRCRRPRVARGDTRRRCRAERDDGRATLVQAWGRRGAVEGRGRRPDHAWDRPTGDRECARRPAAQAFDRGVRPRGDGDRAADRRGPSSGPCVARAPGRGVSLQRPAARRGSETRPRATWKSMRWARLKNAAQQRAWLISRTKRRLAAPGSASPWAPAGTRRSSCTPGALEAPLGGGRLGVRWDGRRSRFSPHGPRHVHRPGLVPSRALKRHVRGRRVVLIWDGLGAHKSRYMTAHRAGSAPRSPSSACPRARS